MLRAVLVDDEPLARQRLLTLLEETGQAVEVVGEAADGKSAVPLIHELRPDVVFLDVQMPVLSGFDVLDLLANPKPYIVFVTAYDEYALRAFEVHALDYLTKPVRRERLQKSLQRIAQFIDLRQPDHGLEALQRACHTVPLQRIALQAGRRLKVVPLTDVHFVEAEDKLVFVHLADSRRLTDFTLKDLERRLDPSCFARIHRAYII